MNIESIFYDIPTINISYVQKDGHSQRQILGLMQTKFTIKDLYPLAQYGC